MVPSYLSQCPEKKIIKNENSNIANNDQVTNTIGLVRNTTCNF